MEQYLEREFAKLEKITKKPKEYHIKEALIRYMRNIESMEGIKETEKIIKEKKYPHDYHIIVALSSYIEDMEAIRILEERVKNKDESKYYTPKEADQRPKGLRAKNDLKKIGRSDPSTAQEIKSKVEGHLASNPKQNGKPLEYEWEDHYRYNKYGSSSNKRV
ncbi:4975_t:CDS:2 [Ambispora leptoticha]|uniref:4975_t:CDS:1 n=1 Tax=Ambispora leptoticha TaxID=144679 RepID=A0A9N9DQN9_9GLOM|nr:4975_t:CDS:2 [Ambispora leptoticha]